eukprot:CAMPEP_0198556248 /NCGR_PEP_ID=MMETSP1462-20131121/86433_1 /TAXON_ID=1333877 /ORGANISM="Brandtodinium nutriculum, Strain RCC3387" /LENGTH=310 /DNA_ID=CAMNT_0044286993 /DNA_START=45 /DNA_END=977 /DNA_ORIENTATION=+
MYVIVLDKNARPSWKRVDAGASGGKGKASKGAAAAPAPAPAKAKSTQGPTSDGKARNNKRSFAVLKSGYPFDVLAQPKLAKKIRAAKLQPLRLKGDPDAGKATSSLARHVKMARTGVRFKTSEWPQDPARKRMVNGPIHRGDDFIAEHFENGTEVGEYTVRRVEITDGAGATIPLIVVYNLGSADCNTGYWGACYKYHDVKPSATSVEGLSAAERNSWFEELVQISSEGDTCSVLKRTAAGKRLYKEHKKGAFAFPVGKALVEEHEISYMEESGEAEALEREHKFDREGCAPGLCKDQISKIVGCCLMGS